MTAGVDGIVTVTFAAGTALPNSMMLPISIQSDEILEGDESFTVFVVEVIDAAEDFIVVDSNVDPLTLTISDDERKLAHGMEVKPLFLPPFLAPPPPPPYPGRDHVGLITRYLYIYTYWCIASLR